MRYLLDTNVLGEIGKTLPHRHVEAWVRRVDDADLAISAITVREMIRGIGRLRRRKPFVAEQIATRMATVFDAFEGRILSMDRPVAELWGQMLAESDRHSEDAGLAATARTHRLVLVTRNVADFRGRGAPLLDPYHAPPRHLA